MAVTTIRVHRETKAALDRWRGRLIEVEGQTLSAEETILRLLRLADRHEAELLGKRIEASAGSVDRWMALVGDGIRDWGVESDASRLDEDLYGT